MNYPNKIFCAFCDTPNAGVFATSRFPKYKNVKYVNAEYVQEALINLYECMQESNREEHFKQRDTLGKLIGEL